ncbi:DUF4249 domain-containing protein [Tenacibaculum jejuense]|uniref:Probable lipoprotein n=1 Tax=Tenacibaculum jejuense TaxID=584609 RepID=A0A238UA06_9FLAO|nr:DUF4249 domain-containing protein [Tenacibaculum jejuense]SNR15388.1 Probable lipoprotein precursor [Tenacibaculum jejuense]
MKQRFFLIFMCTFTLLMIGSCIEPIELNNDQSFKSNIVVRAIITNEFKKHTVKISKTVPINATEANPEKNATVNIIDNNGTTYNFVETSDGIYTSTMEFAAVTDKEYTLKIKTENGNSYTSTPEKLPLVAEIDEIKISVEDNTTENIQEAVVRVNSKQTNDSGKYYRYEFDETYKIQALFWVNETISIRSNTSPYEFELVRKDPDIFGDGTCYGNEKSKEILITETASLNEDQVLGFAIQKIPIKHFKIGRRYSILVKQYVVNQNTYNFYENLKKFSDSNNIFFETQVGNIPNNISSETNPDDITVGFFEVSSVSSKRVFFNRSEFTNIDFEDYTSLLVCEGTRQPRVEDSSGNSPLLKSLEGGWIFLKEPADPSPSNPYILIRKFCGDCSHLGQPTVPSFWVE